MTIILSYCLKCKWLHKAPLLVYLLFCDFAMFFPSFELFFLRCCFRWIDELIDELKQQIWQKMWRLRETFMVQNDPVTPVLRKIYCAFSVDNNNDALMCTWIGQIRLNIHSKLRCSTLSAPYTLNCIQLIGIGTWFNQTDFFLNSIHGLIL